MRDHRSRLRFWAPQVFVALWLVYLGMSLWAYAAASNQPPMWDPYGYVVKAKNFWDCVARAGWCNPLNLQPVVRPPGTILMSYPLGFSGDYHGFHFRSVFLPILCAALVPYLALGWRRAYSWGWGTAVTVLLLTSLPMFFHLEWSNDASDTGAWGLVDSFISGVSGLAAAAIIRSVSSSSVTLLFFGALLGAFAFFIKPSGAMVMVLLSLCWGLLALRSWLSARREHRGRHLFLRYLLPCACLIAIVYALAAWAGVSSLYLSQENLSFAKNALATAAREIPTPPLASILRSFHRSLGAVAAMWACAILALSLSPASPLADREAPGDCDRNGLLLAALGTLLGGVCYWLFFQAIISQIRYLWPFLLASLAYLVPVARDVWNSSRPRARWAIGVLCCLPAAGTAIPLALPDPPLGWQRTAGINVSAGMSRAAEDVTREFLSKHREEIPGATFHVFYTNSNSSIFEHALKFDDLVRSPAAPVTFSTAYDWVRGFVVRTSDLLAADFIIFAPSESAEQPLPGTGSASFLTEQDTFISWLSGLSESEGVRHLERSPTLHILKIVDHPLFETQMQRFIEARSWRTEFAAENPRRWWESGSTLALSGQPGAGEIDFSGLYRVRATALGRRGETLTLELLWEQLQPDREARSRLWFFHVNDPAGAVVASLHLPVYSFPPPDPSRPVRFERVGLTIPQGREAKTVGFGIFTPQPKRAFLRPDRGLRDPDGIRALIPIPPSESANGR